MNLLETTDAKVWADEFIRLHGDKLPDHGLMMAWFANMWAATHDPLVGREMNALGWMYGEACSMLDAGEDLRQVEVPDLIARYMESLQEGSS